MTGNVWEWVSDWYDKEAYSSMESRDPQGPSDGDNKVLRGGSLHHYLPGFMRAADRFDGRPDGVNRTVGFRCVADPVKSEE